MDANCGKLTFAGCYVGLILRSPARVGSFTRPATEIEAVARQSGPMTESRIPDDGRCVYVGNVAKYVEWPELKDFMRQGGEVEYCDMLYTDWGEPRGIGFIRFKTEQEAQHAITTLHESIMEGKMLRVSNWTGRKPGANNHGKMMYKMNRLREVRIIDPEKARIVQRIKSFKKSSLEQKEIWYSYCGAVKDPARHDMAFLHDFVQQYSALYEKEQQSAALQKSLVLAKAWAGLLGAPGSLDLWLPAFFVSARRWPRRPVRRLGGRRAAEDNLLGLDEATVSLHKKYHEATITYTAMNIDWAQHKGYENDGGLNPEEQLAVAAAARSRLFRWPALDPQDLHEVRFGPDRHRFCPSADSAEALGDPGENVFVISQMRRPSRLRHALHELYREGISAKIVDAVDGDGFRSQDEMEKPSA
eukprot:s1700_g2.t1